MFSPNELTCSKRMLEENIHIDLYDQFEIELVPLICARRSSTTYMYIFCDLILIVFFRSVMCRTRLAHRFGEDSLLSFSHILLIKNNVNYCLFIKSTNHARILVTTKYSFV